uniref:Calcineurin B-like protein 1 n=1 Tax=Rhizophora mucronata TaxID=61149 RepID=A0A2P2LKZ5_RHIMU
MIFNKDGFLQTKFCHSDLSIFPSLFTSACKNVCPQKFKNYVKKKRSEKPFILSATALFASLFNWQPFRYAL